MGTFYNESQQLTFYYLFVFKYNNDKIMLGILNII